MGMEGVNKEDQWVDWGLCCTVKAVAAVADGHYCAVKCLKDLQGP